MKSPNESSRRQQITYILISIRSSVSESFGIIPENASHWPILVIVCPPCNFGKGFKSSDSSLLTSRSGLDLEFVDLLRSSVSESFGISSFQKMLYHIEI